MLVLCVIRQTGGLSKPLNRLIAVDELVKMVGYSAWIMFVLAAIESEEPLVELTGEPFCHLVQFVAAFGVTYSYLGGMGIALMRMLYIQFPKWMSRRFTFQPSFSFKNSHFPVLKFYPQWMALNQVPTWRVPGWSDL